MCAWFAVSLIAKRNDIADVAWGLGFVLLSWLAFFTFGEASLRALIICLLVSVWGLRLAYHIHSRNRKKAEDYRYNQWRLEWGSWFYVRSFFQVYLLQGVLLLCIITPVLAITAAPTSPLTVFDILGVALWIIGFTFEVIGDAQLAKFIKNPANKGKLMTQGLWAYTRHPNYFGEVTQWWGLWVVALSTPNGWLSILGPLTITFLIVKVSGIPMLEKKMREHPDFAHYEKTVSVFFPLPPKK
jgi:steroid 5-alpha reductase family enzyme